MSKYSTGDRNVFIQILGKYPIVKDKKTDSYHNEKKKKAWEKIVAEYNDAVYEKRTLIQLKRLWDKIKRSRKNALAEERREMMTTDPSKPPPSPQPEIDDIIPHLKFEIDTDTDSDGIMLNQKSEVSEVSFAEEECPSYVSDLNPSSPPPETAAIQRQTKSAGNTHLTALTRARLELIKMKEEHMENLHKVQLEEAIYKKEAARFVMLQEEAKLNKILNS